MSGTNAGTGQPIYLKCSRCRRGKGPLGDYDRKGNLLRTGKTRNYRSRGRGGTLRTARIAHQLWCTVCGHTGWYAHKDAARKPLWEET